MTLNEFVYNTGSLTPKSIAAVYTTRDTFAIAGVLVCQWAGEFVLSWATISQRGRVYVVPQVVPAVSTANQ